MPLGTDTVPKVIRTPLARLLTAAAVTLSLSLHSPAPAIALDLRHVPLVDQRGAPFTLADLAGRPVIVTFVSTRCHDACPIANAEFSRLSDAFRRQRLHATLLTITLDPRFDTPFVMARSARQYDAQAPRWRFVSGTERNVRTMMRAFGVVATPDRHGIPEVHSSFVYVLDGRGRLARSLLLSSNLPDDVAALFHGKHPLT